MHREVIEIAATRQTRPSRFAGGTLIAVAAAAALTGCEPQATQRDGSTSSSVEPAPSRSSDRSTLRNGEYTQKGWYGSGPSSIDVTIRLEDGEVAAVQVEPNATDPTSLDYQRRFAGGVASLVVGRPLTELGDVVVSGSSSTAAGFDDAVRKIRAEAG